MHATTTIITTIILLLLRIGGKKIKIKIKKDTLKTAKHHISIHRSSFMYSDKVESLHL